MKREWGWFIKPCFEETSMGPRTSVRERPWPPRQGLELSCERRKAGGGARMPVELIS